MLDRLTLDQLRALVAAGEEGSFSAAGRRLRRAQSAVSQSVQILEDELEVQLFDRSGKAPVLTEAGRAVLEDARIVLQSAEALRSRAGTFAADIEPEFAIAVEQMFPSKVLVESLRRLGELFPTVRVTIYADALSSLERRLKSGAAQIGIYPPHKVERGEYESDFLAAIPIVPVVATSHPLALIDGAISNTQLDRHLHLALSRQADDKTVNTRVDDAARRETQRLRNLVSGIEREKGQLKVQVGFASWPVSHTSLAHKKSVQKNPKGTSLTG